MDYTFVVNGDPNSRKRKAPQSACEHCKKRKKRCTHGLETENQTEARHITTISSGTPKPETPSVVLERSSNSGDQRHHNTQPFDPPSASRFIGDLNPEARLVAEDDPGSGGRDRHGVGTWVGEPRRHNLDIQRHQNHQSPFAGARTPGSNAVIQPEETVPPSPMMVKQDKDSLINIYFERINPLLSIVDEADRNEATRKSKSVMYAMCLVASRDAAAQPYLRFTESPELLSARTFASRTYKWLRWALSIGWEEDKVSLIRTLALMSLYSEGSDGAEDASMNLAQAIQHGQTIGLHLGRSSGHGGSQTRLFWSLWCLSNFNAALNGRPRLIFDLDIGLKLEEAYDLCGPAMKVLLNITQLLSRVINLYQPTAALDVLGIEEDFESFETILSRCNAWNIDTNIMTSLEIYYYGIAIISHRARGTSQPSTPTPSSLRQELSALHITTILHHVSPQSFVPLPLVSYSISLAMSSFYSQLRRARSPIKRAASREHLENCVQALEQLAEWSQPAKNMARLGRKALRQTAQVAAISTSPELRRAPRNGSGVGDNIAQWRPVYTPNYESDQLAGAQRNSIPTPQTQPDGGLSGFDIAYDELMDMDAVFGDFLNMNLPDFGLPLQ
ncbi:hypothetical protein D6D13_00034 [Aureobasidium pullulans]|uniref:Xylanolytic transcriptional activator regulatory domain-containing protein n=1 Tax=Aureobasidium pullulans TaxID=5580 RepID=A0A4S9DDF4_AURPU|nr:hypothetical protein D6D13_00034 [Aureobasidium pullulans]